VDSEENILYTLEEYYASLQPEQAVTPSLPASDGEPILYISIRNLTQPDLYTCHRQLMLGPELVLLRITDSGNGTYIYGH